MNYQQISELAIAKNALTLLSDLNDRFLEGCTKNQTSQEFQTRLEVSGSSIRIDCFGHEATADSRLVRAPTGEFAAEYVFNIRHGESRVEVWRCYVTSNGKLAQDPNAQVTFCDYNNSYVANHICGPVLLGALQSKIFAVAPGEGG